MNHKAIWIGLLALVLLFSPQLWADTVTGQCRNNLGQPLAGATIDVLGTNVSVTSNVVGNFTLTLPAGSYNIQISPPPGLGLAPLVIADFVVNGPTSMGVRTLTAGVLISGIVKTPAGLPVVNGDLDVFDDATGIKLVTENDKTTATGSFSLRVPTGVLRLRAEPAAGLILVSQIQTLNVTSNVSVGTITLPQGFVLTGTVRHAVTNLPLAGVDIDVDDLATGQRIQTPGDNTNASGVFSVIVPAGFHTVSFDPIQGQQILIGKQIVGVQVTGPTNMGNITLDPGISITGVLLDNTGFPVPRTDLDVRAQAGDLIIYTPNDKTSPTGTFSVVVPTGTHRVVFQPKRTTGLLAHTTPFMVFNTSTNLGNVVLQPGHLLTGTVTAFGGVPQADCAIIVRDSVTQTRVEVTDKRTDASGNYAVIVPTGTFDINFKTRKGSLARDTTTTNVFVNGPKTVNASLNLLPMFVFVDDPAFPGPQVVPLGAAQIFITVAVYNPNGITTGSLIDVVVEGPFGSLTTIVSGSPTVLGPGNFLFAQFLAVPLSPPLPGNQGLPHKFIIRLRDPLNGSEIDVDEFIYYPG